MSTAATRKQLMIHLAEAEDEKIKALYTILKEDIDKQSIFLTDEHLSILKERRDANISGKSIGSNWKEVHERIRKT